MDDPVVGPGVWLWLWDSGCGVLGVEVCPPPTLSSDCFCFLRARVSLRLLTAWRIEPLAQRAVFGKSRCQWAVCNLLSTHGAWLWRGRGGRRLPFILALIFSLLVMLA